jgi:hypothetical protein
MPLMVFPHLLSLGVYRVPTAYQSLLANRVTLASRFRSGREQRLQLALHGLQLSRFVR